MISAAFLAAGFCGAAQAQPGPDSRGDATVSRADEQAKAGERFAAIDADHDGAISSDEQKAGAQGGQRGSGGGLRRADTDGDGKITRDEYLAAQLRRFDTQDADKDGQLTKAERDAARAAREQNGQNGQRDWGGGLPPGGDQNSWGGPPPGGE